MRKIAVVYWSGTGNTEAMANAVAAGAKAAGAEVTLCTAAEFSADLLDAFDAVAFGCPAMGAEVLEEEEFEPMFSACKAKLSGKRLLCSAPTVGETASGCAPGSKAAPRTGRCLPPKA